MTQPQQPDPNGSAALDQLSQLTAGNAHLITRPVLMSALVNGNATTAQTASINQFVGGLEAQNAVQQLRATGQKIVMPTTMVNQLNAVGATYQDVALTPQQQIQRAVAQMQKQGLVPVYNNGQLIGARSKTAAESEQHQDGWFDSWGGFWHHLTHNPVTNVFSQAWNVVSGAFGVGFQSQKQQDENDALMRSLGYDPNSWVSDIAFASRGLMRGDISGAVTQYGQDRVDQAEQYLENPKKYVANMVQESNQQDPSGQLAAKQMAFVDSQDFGKLLTELSGRQASLGTDLALKVGLDPVKNPTAYSWLAGATNFVASFALDPTMILGKVYKGLKISQVGIKSFSDTSSFARILDKTNRNWFTAPIQDGFQATVDNGNLIRTGLADAAKAQGEGDLKAYASAQTQVTRGYAGLERTGTQALAPALIGTHRVLGLDDKGRLLTTTDGAEAIDTYDKLFHYVTETKGMLALASGKAAVTASLMPGALSRVGSTWLRGVLDGTMDRSRTVWNFKKLDAASKLMPAADDAVDVASGQVVAHFPSVEAQGEVDYNLRRFGNMTGDGVGGALGKEFHVPLLGTMTPGSWINPVAVAARARIVARRLNVTNLLARNNEIDLLDELAAGKIQSFAKLYLSDAHSNMLAAAFAGGDVGARRAIFAGLKRQVFHSAGLYHSEAGTALAEKLMQEDEHLYAHTQDGIMERDPWTGTADQSTALWNAQNRLVYSIPSFGVIHRVAAKSGLYEATLGRAMTSHIADGMLTAFRTGILAVPRTATRATVEGWLNLLSRGNFRAALAAKARTAELGMLPERLRIMQKATGWWLPKAVSTFTRRIEKRGMTDTEGEYLARVAERYPDVAQQVQDSLSQHLLRGDVNPLDASSDALDIARVGLRPVQWEQKGWSAQSAAGYYGAHRLEAALKLRQHGNPETFKAVLNYVEDPSHDNMNLVKDAMLTKAEYEGFRRMRWLSTYRDSGGILQRALNDDEKQVAFEQHASRLVSDLRALVTQQDGSLAHGLLDRIKAHGVPDGDWINENLSNAERPDSAIAPNYLAKVVDDKDSLHEAFDKLGNALQDISGRVYRAVVVNPAERMTSMPSFWMYYVKARSAMADLEKQMIEEGYTSEAADHILMQSAIRQAWVRTEYTVDDPGAKTQMDIVGRNLVMFPRAINAFVRRYGQLVKQDPLVLRKAALALNGAEQMGLIYRNSNGELTYTVPGSNFLVNALNSLGGLMGENIVTLPRGDLTGNLMMSAPGFNNPVRTSLTPMLNIPFHLFENLFPDHREFLTEIDNVLNGPTGANRGVVDELMPAAFRHFYEAMDSRTSGSILASSTISAFSNLVAADPNGDRGIMPKPGDPHGQEKLAALLATLKTQVRNQFYMRAALGLFLPGSPSRPSDMTDGSRPDEAYFLRGARSMSDEFKMMINDYNGDYSAAAQAFAAIHPNDLVYTLPTSTVTEAGLNLPATRNSELWMESHLGLIQKYPLVAAYFAPPATGKFDANAWQAQLALGLRKQSSINDFANTYELRRAQATYFQAYDQMSQLRNASLASGDSKTAAFYKSNFDQQMAPWLATEPQLQQYLSTNDAIKTAQAQEAVSQLRNMISSGDASGLTNVHEVGLMLNAFDAHNKYQADHAIPSADRTYEDATFGAFMTKTVETNTDLVGLYNVFRAIDWQALPSLTQAAV